ncbi:hypothetical protein EJ04DRAFT_579811 [Polyplosphaeria fusca]|uniref:Uncharacterized protein n=1 Tax=Polyplosphaeria fusca TaxID=682080 RepID=A0A9P4QT72_9PLEO|nr:hypothetical protein EJ04DRAFT_579811 [Polyplosphaeria fusca]
MSNFLARLFTRTPRPSPLPPFDFARNPYRAKKSWPPNLKALTDKQQFRLERKWKRRNLLKSTRPRWNRWIKIVQWTIISSVVAYGVLWYDFPEVDNGLVKRREGEEREVPFERLRRWFWGSLGLEGFWSERTEVATRSSPSAPGRYRRPREGEAGMGWGEEGRVVLVGAAGTEREREPEPGREGQKRGEGRPRAGDA